MEAATGKPVVLYALPVFTKTYPIADAYVSRDRWVRRLFKRPENDNWSVWQVSDRGRVKGIGEPTDIDVWSKLK